MSEVYSSRLLTGIIVLLFTGCGARRDGIELHRKAVLALREGNSKQALRLAGEARKRCRSGSECDWSARLLEAEVLLYDDQTNRASAALSEQPPASARFAALTARRTWLQGELEAEKKHLKQAESLYLKARRTASSAGAWDVVSEIDCSRAQLLFERHHNAEEAAALLREVAEQSARRQDPYYEAIALNGLGMIRRGEWRFDEAIPLFQRAIEAAARGGGQRLIFVASNNLMICYYRLGRLNDAVRSYLQAADLLDENGPAAYHMHLLSQMGNTLHFESRVPEEIQYYRQAASFARTDEDAARCYRNLASAYAVIQDWNAAEESINRALAYTDDAESRPTVDEIRAAIATGRGKYDEARTLYFKAIADARNNPEVLWESHAALARIYNEKGENRKADEEFSKTIEIIDNNVDRISTPDNSLTFFSLQIVFYQDYVRALIARNEFQRALEVADSSRARLLMQRLKLSQKTQKTPAADYPSIARRLNSVLLFYWIAARQSYLWVVTPDGIHPPIRLPPAEEIRKLVEQYAGFIEDSVGDPMSPDSPSNAGDKLYKTLIVPAAQLIPRDARVILVPDDALNFLNFETLPVYANPPGEAPHYWIEDVSLEIAPSLRVLSTDTVAAPHRPASLMVIGDPAPPPGSEFPRLEYASKEIEKIEARFARSETVKFMGAAACPKVYRSARPERFSFIHFSAHAEANKESPLDSAIILSPDGQGQNYKLYARNVVDTGLNADLVTISACRSAGSRSYSGEGLVGFAWAFLKAGAHHVIAGLWDVTDSATPDIMDVLYSKITAEASPVDALRDAKLNLIHSKRSFRRPYYWGPLQIYTR